MPALTDAALRELDISPVGEGVRVNPQTPGGDSDLITTRHYELPSDLITSYLFKIINPTVRVKDPHNTNAYLVSQTVQKKTATKAILVCVFAEMPTAWLEPSGVEDYLFPSFTGINVAGLPGVPASRTTPAYLQSPVSIQHDFFLGAAAVTKPVMFEPITSAGNLTNALTDTTFPDQATYEVYAAAGTLLNIRWQRRRWMGDIWERTITQIQAR